MDKNYLRVENIDCYKTTFELSNTIWEIVVSWKYFERDTLGKQLVSASKKKVFNSFIF
jgi:hypothetical protein